VSSDYPECRRILAAVWQYLGGDARLVDQVRFEDAGNEPEWLPRS
jgi:hypothetical protein